MPPIDRDHYSQVLDNMEATLRRKRAPLSVIRSVVEARLAVEWLEQQDWHKQQEKKRGR